MQYLILLIRDIQLWKRTKRWIFRFSNCLIRRLIFNHPIVLVQNRVCFSWTLSAFSGSGDYYNCVSYLSMINTRCHTHLHARVCVCVYMFNGGGWKNTPTPATNAVSVLVRVNVTCGWLWYGIFVYAAGPKNRYESPPKLLAFNFRIQVSN